MLTVVCWKWKSPQGYRSTFLGEHVNILRNMVKRHLQLEHEFVCVTDDPTGIDEGVRVVPLWNDFEDLQSFVGNTRPACYRRLKVFNAEAAGLGERVLSIDLDAVITADITPLVDRDDDFVIWGDTARGTLYNGGFWLLRRGTRQKVWSSFDPLTSPMATRAAGIIGSDQAWISYSLGKGQATWTVKDGVYSFRNHLKTRSSFDLPPDAKLVMFHGAHDPWDADVQHRYPWVREHYK